MKKKKKSDQFNPVCVLQLFPDQGGHPPRVSDLPHRIRGWRRGEPSLLPGSFGGQGDHLPLGEPHPSQRDWLKETNPNKKKRKDTENFFVFLSAVFVTCHAKWDQTCPRISAVWTSGQLFKVNCSVHIQTSFRVAPLQPYWWFCALFSFCLTPTNNVNWKTNILYETRKWSMAKDDIWTEPFGVTFLYFSFL